MRIFLVYHPSGNSSVPGSMTWRRNLYEPLLDLGHEVYEFRFDKLLAGHKVPRKTERAKEILSNELPKKFLEEHTKKPFDFFLAYLTDYEIEPDVVNEIKKQSVPTANFSCNNTHQFHLTEKIAPLFDYNLHSEKHAGKKFQAIGANPVWFQMAANPKYFKPLGLPFQYDVSFVGASYAKRAKYIKYLLDNGIKTDCFGPNWLINRPNPGLKKIYKEFKNLLRKIERSLNSGEEKKLRLKRQISDYELGKQLRKNYPEAMHYPVSDEEMMEIINRSRINLGSLEVYTQGTEKEAVKTHLHLREFEVPMSGSLYMTNYSAELAEHYVPDKEVLVFRNEEELLEKVRYFLLNETEAEKIRKAGLERALACHTYQKRYQDFFTAIFKH